MSRRWLLVLSLVSPLALGQAQHSLELLQQAGQRNALSGNDADDEQIVPRYLLQDPLGRAVSNEDFRGRFQLIAFGYTYCPDICPTTLAQLAAVYPELKAQIPNLQVVMLSVDPGRDSGERLAGYVPHFHREFIAVTGPHPQLQPLVAALGLVYARHEGSTPDDYLVDHSASLVLINPAGLPHGRFAPLIAEGQLAIFDSAQLLRELPQLVADYQR